MCFDVARQITFVPRQAFLDRIGGADEDKAVIDAGAIAKLKALRKRFKLLMGLMLFFMVAAPLLGPVIYAEAFSHLSARGRTLYYIASPIVFGLLFLFYRWMDQRASKAIEAYK